MFTLISDSKLYTEDHWLLYIILSTFSKEKVAPSEKFPPIEEIEKWTKTLEDMDNNKFTEILDLPVRNDSVTRNNKKKSEGWFGLWRRKKLSIITKW